MKLKKIKLLKEYTICSQEEPIITIPRGTIVSFISLLKDNRVMFKYEGDIFFINKKYIEPINLN